MAAPARRVLRDGDRGALVRFEQVELRGRVEPVAVYVLTGRADD